MSTFSFVYFGVFYIRGDYQQAPPHFHNTVIPLSRYTEGEEKTMAAGNIFPWGKMGNLGNLGLMGSELQKFSSEQNKISSTLLRINSEIKKLCSELFVPIPCAIFFYPEKPRKYRIIKGARLWIKFEYHKLIGR